MKLHFEPNLDYQLEAIEAVCDLFRGQETCASEFTVLTRPEGDARFIEGLGAERGLGFGNPYRIDPNDLLENLRHIQLRHALPPASALASSDFTVEMETGTGKTYVYLRTIFELNRRYGFTKFVIVVPSVAIKEGVYKTLQITTDHFRSLYAGVPFDYFLYDSAKLGQVRNFATSSTIQIMVVTVGAINKKDVNNLYAATEMVGGEKPIDLIRATRPVLILDEPQTLGLGSRGGEALDAMQPLCRLHYSATPPREIPSHVIYRLDAVNAYERKLVKQIEVAAATVEHAHNRPFVRFVSASNTGGVIQACVELDIATAGGGARRVERNVQTLDHLEQETGREIYRDVRIGEINVAKGNELLELRVPGGTEWLRRGEAWGDVDALAVQRQMIRRVILEHLTKARRLRPLGIKVLSLFFIDRVDKYRRGYADDGSPIKGDYATIFEEEYHRLVGNPNQARFFEESGLPKSAEIVHDGYFAIDKKGGKETWIDVGLEVDKNKTSRESTERAFKLIMREKEKLLSFEEPLAFIFSHSALKEGWDNPNVFQICSLREMGSERELRQTIGRGLRLAVNQDGERIRGFEVNTLTVIANESYEAFAETLQKEIEKDTGISFGKVEKEQFADIRVERPGGGTQPLGTEASGELWEYLRGRGMLDAGGKIQEPLEHALANESLELPTELEPQRPQIIEILKKLAGKIEIRNADERRSVRPRQAVLQSPEFVALWNRIKTHTTYRVAFDNQKLIDDCTNALRDAPPAPRSRITWRRADLAIGRSGVVAEKSAVFEDAPLDEGDIPIPDLLTELQNRTQLTRRSLQQILRGSGRLSDARRNPQYFLEITAKVINQRKRLALVDGIKYQRKGGEHFYAQELFTSEELTGYVRNMLESHRSVYDHVLYGSEVERNFADQLEHHDSVKVYAKLPAWFKIPTPLGTYNPDWAVVVVDEQGERLYLVVETKSTLFLGELRDRESGKIRCGKAHFEAIAVGENPAKYTVARDLPEALEHAREEARA